ncbi:MAG: GLUG motif-containing protein [Chloroflexota bacterium]|nr:GLUG motif-containing protein [Chloroflexota bacterium]
MKTIHGSRKHHYFRIVSIFLVAAALMAGMVACEEQRAPTSEIWDWYDLDAIRDNLSGSHLLMKDLDSATAGYTEVASETANQGKGWDPIGTEDNPFTGNFDGQGYEIGDLFIDRPSQSNVGIFGVVDARGFVRNVGVVNADVTGDRNVGTLVGLSLGTVSNSYSSGSVSGGDQVGGLIGLNAGTVSDSHSTGSVSGIDLVGGLVGGSTKTVSNSHSGGTVHGESRVGGLAGGINGIVSNSYSSASASGDRHIGGLVGYANEGTVSNCHSTGSVTGDSYIGGLVGWNRDTVRDCYSSGSVTGEWLVGGLVGHNRGTVSSSYSTGSVTGNEDVGGLVGRNYEGTVSNCYWDTKTSGQATSDGGTGKTTAEMKSIATFTAWDIIAVTPGQTNSAYIWNIINGATYPFLSGQS